MDNKINHVVILIKCPECGKILGKNYNANGEVRIFCRKCKRERFIWLKSLE